MSAPHGTQVIHESPPSAGGASAITMNDNVKLCFGASKISCIYSDGSHTFWDVTTGALAFRVATAGAPTPIAGQFLFYNDTDVVKLVLEARHTTGDDIDIRFRRARASGAAVVSGDVLGAVDAWGHDGTAFVECAAVGYRVNGAVSTGIVPADIFFRIMDGAGSFVNRLVYTPGAFAFQEETVISTTSGDLTLNPSGAVTISKDINHDGTNIGLYGVVPVARSPGWTITNDLVDRLFDADLTSLNEVADLLATLITDLAATGIIGASA